MITFNRRKLLLAGAAASFIPQRQAAAQPSDYPNRPLKIIVASPVGGLMDNFARMLAEQFTSRFGQPALVDNRPGAGGIVGIEALVKAPPDGYTILFGSTGMFFQARVMFRKLPYDLDKDIAPIAIVPTGPPKPCSIIVGTSGIRGERTRPVTPIGRRPLSRTLANA